MTSDLRMSSYIPPHRRAQVSSNTPASDAAASEVPPSFPAPAHPRYSNRGGHGGYRGQRGGPRGGSRGNFGRRNQPDRQLVEDADTIRCDDITRYFWPRDYLMMTVDMKHATLHDSAARSGQLCYMQLYMGANPRWNSDEIVFAKSPLQILPGYIEQKEKSGPSWGLPEEDKNSTAGKASLQAEDSNDTVKRNDAPEANVIVSSTWDDAAGHSGVVKDATGTTNSTGENGHETNQTRSPIHPTQGNGSGQNLGSHTPSSPSDVKTVPASEFYSENSTPNYPSIPPIDYAPDPHDPIAVFQEVRSVSNKKAFIFSGWYGISRVNIIAPHSAELIRMLQQKWERRDRFGNVSKSISRDLSAWKSSMKHEWAVVKFNKLGDGAPPVPQIEKTEMIPKQSEGPERSVTEMLQEMRLKDGNLDIGNPEDVNEKSHAQSVDDGEAFKAVEPVDNAKQENIQPGPALS
ncbi:hypothetical protein SCUP515_00160 [Seiridium cupressi]